MSSLTPIYIAAFDKGFINYQKPLFLPDDAFAVMENAYAYRNKLVKREGEKLLGRLRRTLSMVSIGNISAAGAGTFTFNIFTATGISTTQPNAEIEPGNITGITITIAAPISQTLTDTTGSGKMSVTAGPITLALINYSTGDLILTFSGAAGASAATFTGAYYPDLPVMGTIQQEQTQFDDENTIWFDTMFAYQRAAGIFVEYITTPPNTWTGNNSQFFWGYNYFGSNVQTKLLFVTNFNLVQGISPTYDPIRYTNGATWTNFQPIYADVPQSAAQSIVYQARIIIGYYGHLLLLNTWEGTTAGTQAAAKNFQNRCRFSGPAFGDPTLVDAFRVDIFGLGGVIDAPTSEAIVDVKFVKNTLLVLFERSTWQLTYIGEYGLPFVWERTSIDFGGDSTFSSVIYENNLLAIGNLAIIAANSTTSQRIDLQIPDQIFQINRFNDGVKRVYGVRDYRKELIYWNYPDAQTWASNTDVDLIYPNKVLVYNYRLDTWSIFRDNVTNFGKYQYEDEPDELTTWDSLDVTWDDEAVLWDDPATTFLFEATVAGNQQGYVHIYNEETPGDPSLSITAMTSGSTPFTITSPDHNLINGDIIYITGCLFVNSTTGAPIANPFNGNLFKIVNFTENTFQIQQWNFTSQVYVNIFYNPANAVYLGGGQITLFPLLNVQTKDINIFSDKGLNIKLAHLDFLVQPFPGSAFSVTIAMNSSVGVVPEVIGNLATGNKSVTNDTKEPFYTYGVDYAWFRFFAPCNGQFFRVIMTYDDNLMNTYSTHSILWTLYAMTAYVRPGGRNLFT